MANNYNENLTLINNIFYSWYLGGFLIICPDLVLSSTFGGVDTGELCFVVGLGVVGEDGPVLLIVFDGLFGMSNLGTKGLLRLVVGIPKDTLVLCKWTQLQETNQPSSVATTYDLPS